MTEAEKLVDPATLRVRFVGNPVTDKAVALKVIRTTDEEAAFYACSACQRSHLEKANAEKCCSPSTCDACGTVVQRYYTLCERHREGKRLAKAEIVQVPPCAWVFDPQDGGSNDGYFASIEDLLEWYAEEDESATPPAYAYACKVIEWKGVSIDDVIQNVLDNHHQDAEESIVDLNELEGFLETWNAKQTIISYEQDCSKVIPIDAEAFAALIAELKRELATEAA